MIATRAIMWSVCLWFLVCVASAPAPVRAETATESFRGNLVRVEDAGALLRNEANRELLVRTTGLGAVLNGLCRADVVEVRYAPVSNQQPVTVDAIQVVQGHFQGVLEQLEETSVRVRLGQSDVKACGRKEGVPQPQILTVPAGLVAITKGLSPGDAVEGIYIQEGADKPKFLQMLALRRAALSTSAATAVMGGGLLAFFVLVIILLRAGEPIGRGAKIRTVTLKLRKLVIGKDGRTSNSKTQASIWFGVLTASYIATLALRLIVRGISDIGGGVGGIEIPQNLLLLSGISGGTFVGAKLMTANRVASGLLKTTADAASPADLFTDDRGQFDLGDFQMFAWVLLAAAVYLFQMVAFLKSLPLSASVSLPDVDTTLLSFFGIGQGAYLAKKAGAEVQARVFGITPPEAKPGAIVAISGSGFGEPTGYVRFGTAMARVISWHETSVSVEVPRGLRPGSVPVQVVLTVQPAAPATALQEVPLPAVSFAVL